MLVLVVRLGPTTVALVRKLEEVKVLERCRRLFERVGINSSRGWRVGRVVDVDTFASEELGGGVVIVILVLVGGIGWVVDKDAEDILMNANGLLEVVRGEASGLFALGGLRLVLVASRCVELGEELVRLDGDWSAGTVGSARGR